MSDGETRPRPTGRFEGRDLGDEYVFYDHQGDQVHLLNGTARDIYLSCDGEASLEQIAAKILEQYDVEPERAIADVRETVRLLTSLGLLSSD